jgi:hypothetical protein
MTQRKEHSWNEWDYENRRTPVRVMMLTNHERSKPASFVSCRDACLDAIGVRPSVHVVQSPVSMEKCSLLLRTRGNHCWFHWRGKGIPYQVGLHESASSQKLVSILYPLSRSEPLSSNGLLRLSGVMTQYYRMMHRGRFWTHPTITRTNSRS